MSYVRQPAPGLFVVEDFISPDLESRLIADFLSDEMMIRGSRRRCRFYGNIYAGTLESRRAMGRYETSGINDLEAERNYHNPITDASVLSVMKHLEERWGIQTDQANANLYGTADELRAHKDEMRVANYYYPWVFTLSLGSSARMELVQDRTDRVIPVLLKPRSLLFMTFEALYLHRHRIAPGGIFLDSGETVHPLLADHARREGIGPEQAVRISYNFRKVSCEWTENGTPPRRALNDYPDAATLRQDWRRLDDHVRAWGAVRPGAALSFMMRRLQRIEEQWRGHEDFESVEESQASGQRALDRLRMA